MDHPATIPPGPAPMQAVVDEASAGDPRESRIAPVAGPALFRLLLTFDWVHSLGGVIECEGCANDGEEGYCQGAGPAPLADQTDDEVIYCHCGHAVEVAWYPPRPTDEGEWRCAGEDSEHWPKDDSLMAECGHCAWSPDEGEIVDHVLAGRLTLEGIAEYHDGNLDYAARIGLLAAEERDRRRREELAEIADRGRAAAGLS